MKKKFIRKPETWWKGRRVITLMVVSNSLGTVPPGTIGIVTRKYGGLTVDMEPCESCGLSLKISRVPYEKLDLASEIL